MIVEIIKRHPVGIEVGVIKDMKYHVAWNLIEEGYAIESSKDRLDEYKQQLKDEKAIESAKIRATIIEKISAEKAEKIANQEKKNSDADAKHAITEAELEALKSEYYNLGVQEGTVDGYKQGHTVGHAEGYKLGYEACLDVMANNIFPEPEAEQEITCSQTDIEPVITDKGPAPEAEAEKPKRGRPSKAE